MIAGIYAKKRILNTDHLGRGIKYDKENRIVCGQDVTVTRII